MVDFGWLSILAKPLFLLVNWFNGAFMHNFGWSIVLVTIALNLILFPIKLSNMKSMRKMQALKPQMDAINDKYKGLKMTDPRKGQQQQEVMDLYKKYGVNPMGGCVPMLLQIPFFIAFYKVFTVSVEMRGANWLWVTDLSQPEHLAIRILPLIMIGTQFFMQKMTPQGNVDPNQQKMMMFMPLIFGFMFYNFASGLVLYYLTSNLVGIGQQWFFNHTQSAIDAARSVEPPEEKERQEIEPSDTAKVLGFYHRTQDRRLVANHLGQRRLPRQLFEIQDGDPGEDDFETPDVVVKFSGPDVDLLLSNKAELLLALEHITMEILRMPSDDHSRVSFDANDYRLLRIEELRLSAVTAAEKVKRTGVPFRFNPMNSRERRVIHLALRNETGGAQ